MTPTNELNSIKHIEDINIGGLYHIPHYNMPIYDIDDPNDTCDHISYGHLQNNTAFVVLELHAVKLKNYNNSLVYRIKILTGTGNVGWLSLQDKDLEYIMPVTSCDKEL